MADLSFLEAIPGTVDAINRAHEAARQPRRRLGLSRAGHECPRYLWYRHHGHAGDQPSGRVLRLFELGNVVENIIIGDLSMAGCLVYHQQREVVFTQDGVSLVGHIDGIVRGLVEAPETPHLFECKTANRARFNELEKLGSYADWSPVYGWQVQFYCLGLGLKRAAVFVYCKDDSRLYMERIRLDKEATIERLQQVFAVITSEAPPDRLCPRADHYKAKFCPLHGECFQLAEAPEAVTWL